VSGHLRTPGDIWKLSGALIIIAEPSSPVLRLRRFSSILLRIALLSAPNRVIDVMTAKSADKGDSK
jgi:hypothetical protein